MALLSPAGRLSANELGASLYVDTTTTFLVFLREGSFWGLVLLYSLNSAGGVGSTPRARLLLCVRRRGPP